MVDITGGGQSLWPWWWWSWWSWSWWQWQWNRPTISALPGCHPSQSGTSIEKFTTEYKKERERIKSGVNLWAARAVEGRFSLFSVYNFYYLRKSVLFVRFGAGAASVSVALTDDPNSLCTALHCIVNGNCCKMAPLCVFGHCTWPPQVSSSQSVIEKKEKVESGKTLTNRKYTCKSCPKTRTKKMWIFSLSLSFSFSCH